MKSITETILVVEDSSQVLELARSVLETGGYRVLTADTAEAALRVSREFLEPIDLLLVDLVLPDRSGVELVDDLCKERGGCRVLFMSGYPVDVASLYGIDPGRGFLRKPFRPTALLQRVRELLDEDPGASGFRL